MPWLTPDSIPEGDNCRPLLIPASSEWLAIVSGALTELTLRWNWEQQGSVTVDEAIAAMQAMIVAYYDGCAACRTQPSGARLIRIGEDGHLEQVSDDGETWEQSTGDYAYPPVPEREGGTPDNEICLAARNAENVLHQIYEQLAAYFADELSPAVALTELIDWLIATFAIAAGTIVFALGAFLLPVLLLLWGALAYLFADLWDGNFSSALICTLIECATNTDGVVTFDWDCIEHKLYAAAVTFEINETQLRLYAQINYIIWILGGVDALNTMGATTEITDDDCSFCGLPPPTLEIAIAGFGTGLTQISDFVWQASSADTGAGDFWLLLVATDITRVFKVDSVVNLSTGQAYNEWKQVSPNPVNSFESFAFLGVDGLNGFGYSRASGDDPISQTWQFTLVQQD